MKFLVAVVLLLSLTGCARVFDILLANHSNQAVSLLIHFNNKEEAQRIATNGLRMLKGLPSIDDVDLDEFEDSLSVTMKDSLIAEVTFPPSVTLHLGRYINQAKQIKRLRIGDCELTSPFDCTTIDKKLPVLGWNRIVIRYDLGIANSE